MSRLKLDNLTKYFGDVKAIEGINLTVPDEQFTVLLGPSGCGKSTTLRIIAGLESQSRGEVRLEKKEISHLSPSERGIAMVFQDLALYPHVSAKENMSLALEVKGYTDEEIERLVKETAETLGISEFLDRKPGNLSGGQAQRVALGRAMVRDPEVMLFDEPLSSLDAKLRIEMRKEILRVQKDLNTTTVYVTHNQEEAMEIADKIAIYYPYGEISQVGSPLALFQKPENIYTADFFGSPPINIVNGSIDNKGSQLIFEKEDFKLDISSRVDNQTKEMQLGIRPRDLAVGKGKGDKDSENKLTAQVDLVRHRGDEKLLNLKSGKDKLTAVVEKDKKYSIGEEVDLYVNNSNTYIFDENSGETLSFPGNLENGDEDER